VRIRGGSRSDGEGSGGGSSSENSAVGVPCHDHEPAGRGEAEGNGPGEGSCSGRPGKLPGEGTIDGVVDRTGSNLKRDGAGRLPSDWNGGIPPQRLPSPGALMAVPKAPVTGAMVNEAGRGLQTDQKIFWEVLALPGPALAPEMNKPSLAPGSARSSAHTLAPIMSYRSFSPLPISTYLPLGTTNPQECICKCVHNCFCTWVGRVFGSAFVGLYLHHKITAALPGAGS